MMTGLYPFKGAEIASWFSMCFLTTDILSTSLKSFAEVEALAGAHLPLMMGEMFSKKYSRVIGE